MRLGRATRAVGAAQEGRGGSLALGKAGGFGGGDNSQLYKKAPTLSRREPLQPGEPGVANGRRPIFLAKEIKQQGIRGEEGGTRESVGGGRKEVEREEEDRVGEVVRVWTLGVVQRSLIVDPCFWGSAFGKAPVVGHGMGRGRAFVAFWGCVWEFQSKKDGTEGVRMKPERRRIGELED